MLKRFIAGLNLLVALLVIGLVIVYASIAIPVTLGVFVGFILLFWFLSHTADVVIMGYHRLKRLFSRT